MKICKGLHQDIKYINPDDKIAMDCDKENCSYCEFTEEVDYYDYYGIPKPN